MTRSRELPAWITLDTLTRMLPDERARLHENARRLRDQGGQAIMDFMDASGLPLRAGGLTSDDPVILEMQDVIWSDEGRTACLEATRQGLPALAGVEPLIAARLGARYHPHDQGTMSAGSIVGELMRHLGHEPTGKGAMPPGSVAKTAATWAPRRR